MKSPEEDDLRDDMNKCENKKELGTAARRTTDRLLSQGRGVQLVKLLLHPGDLRQITAALRPQKTSTAV